MCANARIDMATDPDARALRDSLRRLIVAHGALDEARRPCGTPLPAPHAWALLELLAEGPMTVTALAERLNIDRTNVSRLCARMEAANELERVVHPEDARARLVRLTRHGAALARRVDRSSAAHFESLLESLHADASELVATLDSLTRAMAGPDTPPESS